MDDDDLPHLILEVSSADEWPQMHDFCKAKRIPEVRRPVALQPSRKIAEAEAERLARRHPDKRFVVFAPVVVGMTVTIPTHVNFRGEVKHSERRAAIVGIDDGEAWIPF